MGFGCLEAQNTVNIIAYFVSACSEFLVSIIILALVWFLYCSDARDWRKCNALFYFLSLFLVDICIRWFGCSICACVIMNFVVTVLFLYWHSYALPVCALTFLVSFDFVFLAQQLIYHAINTLIPYPLNWTLWIVREQTRRRRRRRKQNRTDHQLHCLKLKVIPDVHVSAHASNWTSADFEFGACGCRCTVAQVFAYVDSGTGRA